MNYKISNNCYSGLKDAGQILRLVFITGISKFARMSTFSGLNHLYNLTLDEKYAALIATQQELDEYYASETVVSVEKCTIQNWKTELF